jgi:putative SOS response-associated peptidase YedK
MCSRFALFQLPESIVKEYQVKDFQENYNIAPFSESLIFEKGSSSITEWGIKLPKLNVINARIETYLEKPTFRNSKPCIVPMNGFYEWKAKVPYYFHSENLLFCCGLIVNGKFVILTGKANESVSKVHDRMPLFTKEPDKWLDNRKTDDIELKSYQVSQKVNSVSYSGKDAIKKAVTLGSF